MTVKIDDDAVINNVIFTDQGSAPATPGAGKTRVFTKSDGLYIIDDDGAVIGPFITGTASSNDSVIATCYLEANQSISNNTGTTLNFADVLIDTHSFVTVGSNWKFQPNIAGYYTAHISTLLNATTTWATIERAFLTMRKNAETIAGLSRIDDHSTGDVFTWTGNGAPVVYLDGVSDYIDFQMNQNSGGTLVLSSGSNNWVSIYKV